MTGLKSGTQMTDTQMRQIPQYNREREISRRFCSSMSGFPIGTFGNDPFLCSGKCYCGFPIESLPPHAKTSLNLRNVHLMQI